MTAKRVQVTAPCIAASIIAIMLNGCAGQPKPLLDEPPVSATTAKPKATSTGQAISAEQAMSAEQLAKAEAAKKRLVRQLAELNQATIEALRPSGTEHLRVFSADSDILDSDIAAMGPNFVAEAATLPESSESADFASADSDSTDIASTASTSSGGAVSRHLELRVGSLTISGGLDRRSIFRALRANHHRLRACMKNELANPPSLHGRLTQTFVVNARGDVSTVIAKADTVGSPKLRQCVSRTIKRMHFPAPKNGGNANVTLPLIITTHKR